MEYKTAICFFGITRSLKYTLNSIKKNIFEVLKKKNIDYDIYCHTYSIDYNYINYRAKELVSKDNIDNNEYKLLGPNYVEIDNQQEIINKIDLKKYRSRGDPWKTKDFNTLNNYILAQYSKHRLVNMIEKNEIKYKYIIFMRPDCEYIMPLDINNFKYVNDNTICTPNFHLWGPYNMNDRFAITNMNNYKIYGNIFLKLYKLSLEMQIHSETVLGQILVENFIKTKRLNFYFNRIRMNGSSPDKFTYINNKIYLKK
jgi:hypothetical protein